MPIRPTSQVAAKDALALDDEKAAALGLAHRARGAGEDGEALGEAGRAGRPRLGQREAPPRPLDERRADLLLERPHLLGDRRLGDVQLLRGADERQPARDRLEGAQRIERRQPVDWLHRIALSFTGINIDLKTTRLHHISGPKRAQSCAFEHWTKEMGAYAAGSTHHSIDSGFPGLCGFVN